MKSIFCIAFFTIIINFSFSQKNVSFESSSKIIEEGIKKHNEKDYSGAIEEYAKVSINDTNYIIARYEQALSLVASEKYLEAQPILKEILISEVPNTLKSSVYKLLAQTYESEKKLEEALKTYDMGLKEFPLNYHLYYAKGITFEVFEKKQEAIECYKKAINCNIGHASSHLRLGMIAGDEGYFVQSYLSLFTFILLESNTTRTREVVAILEQLANGSKDVVSTGLEISKSASDDYEELNLLFKNQIALKANYKTKFTIATDYAKQLHLILNNIKFNENEYGFWNNTYVEFFKEVNSNNLLDQLVLHSLKTVDSESIAKKVKSNEKNIQKFSEEVKPIWIKYSPYQYLNIDGSMKKYYTVYSNDGTRIGTVNEKNQAVGDWKYYHKEGNLNLTGSFKNDKRNGVWIWRNAFTNKISEESIYVDGLLEGESKIYYPTGELMEKKYFEKNVLQKEYLIYYRNGQLKQKISVKNGTRDGEEIAYYENGNVKYKIFNIENKANGEYKYYFPNNAINVECVFENDLINSVRKSYYKSGQVEEEKIFVKGVGNGEFKKWHANGQLKLKANLKNDNYIGETIEYYSNGKIYSKSVFDENGKNNGLYELFDLNGLKYQDFEYKKGDIITIRNFDETGKIVKTIQKSGKRINYEALYPNTRTVQVSGDYLDNKRDGKWKFFDKYGNVEAIENYKDGELSDTNYFYFGNGQVKSKVNYNKGKRDGLYLEYNIYGTLVEEGFFREDEPMNDWYEYYPNGTLKNEYAFKGGVLHGYYKHYAVNGKVANYDIYFEGKVVSTVFLDTLGNEMQRFGEYNGLVSLKNATNKFVYYEANYKNGVNDGELKWFDSKKNIVTSGVEINDLRHGVWNWYNAKGIVVEKYNYVLGNKSGTCYEYFDNGKIKYKADYVDNELNGESIFYYENGKTEVSTNFFENSRQGKSVTFAPTGELMYIRYYDDGVLVSFSYLDKTGKEITPIKISNENASFTAFYVNGVKSISQKRKFGVLDGAYLKYYPNGKVMEEENYLFGESNGKHFTYYESGVKKSEIDYKYDVKHGFEIHYYESGKIKSKQFFVLDNEHGDKIEYGEDGKEISRTKFYNNGEVGAN